LSSYADQLHVKLDDSDTRQLENHLSSLSKFYYTLHDGQNNEDKSFSKMPGFTLNSLVDVAKPVSDRMIISRMQANIRLNENKLLLKTYDTVGEDRLDPDKEHFNSRNPTDYDLQKEAIEFVGENTAIRPANSNYPLMVVDAKNRPKSTSYIDWRGNISTGHAKIK
jgi:hypothetical protein